MQRITVYGWQLFSAVNYRWVADDVTSLWGVVDGVQEVISALRSNIKMTGFCAVYACDNW